jgi:hypothetical protein
METCFSLCARLGTELRFQERVKGAGTERQAACGFPYGNLGFAEFAKIHGRGILCFEQCANENCRTSINQAASNDLLVAIHAIDGRDL